MPLQYTYVPLEGATLVERKHERDIVPPMMAEVKNMLLSRSDNSITLRPDWGVASDRPKAYGQALELAGTEDDFLNTVTGLYGTDNRIFFSSFFPMDESNDPVSSTAQVHSTIISKQKLSDGTTARVTSGSKEVIMSDNTFNINQEAWQGCVIVFDDDANQKSWVIERVLDDTTIILETAADFTDTTTEFTVFQNHNYRNDGYKFHVEQFLSNTLYNTPHIDDDASLLRITGPWAASIVVTDESDSFTVSKSLVTQASSRVRVSDGEMTRKVIAGGDTVVINAGLSGDADGDDKIAYSIDPTTEDNWTLQELDDTGRQNADEDPLCGVIFDGTKFWAVGSAVPSADSGNLYVCIWEITDANPPVSTIHFGTGASAILGAGVNAAPTSLCLNVTDGELWATYSIDGAASSDVYRIDTTTFAVTKFDLNGQMTVPEDLRVKGMEFSATAGVAGQIMLVGNGETSGSRKATLYDCDGDSWSNKGAGPGAGNLVYGLGVYDDTSKYVWVALYDNRIGIYNSGSTSAFEDSGFVLDGDYTEVSNTLVWTQGGGNIYETVLVASGGQQLGTIEIDAANEDIESVRQFGVTTYAASTIPAPCPGLTYGVRRYVLASATSSTGASAQSILGPDTVETFTVQSGELTPISDLYRSRAFGILNGYVVLFGCTEYDATADEWNYTPRRIRWTAPATVSNFVLPGSGTADVKGNGEFLDARSVNGRIVTFESSSMGSLIPRGIVDDPWDYEVIHEGIKILSNPVVVNDKIYFVASDGLLWMTDGIAVQESGSSFDLTKYDDFDENKPTWLVFSERLNSLLVFYPEGSSDTVAVISLANGGVGRLDLNELADATAEDPKAIVAIENSSDTGVYVTHNAESSDTDRIVLGSLETGEKITGIDNVTDEDEDFYWYGRIQTGQVFLVPEGTKLALKHVIINTYTGPVAATDNPDIIVEVKSLEDTAWHSAKDSFLTDIYMDTGSVWLVDNAKPNSSFSNLLTTDSGQQDYYVPWLVDNCKFYRYVDPTYTEMTAGTTPSNTVYQKLDTHKVRTNVTSGDVYVYCDNEPFVRAKIGDYAMTDDGYHRFTGIGTFRQATLDRYLSSGSIKDGVHRTAEQMAAGSGAVKVGVNKLVEGVLIRITVLPRHAAGETGQPTVAKITGIALGYVPAALKTLEATGG